MRTQHVLITTGALLGMAMLAAWFLSQDERAEVVDTKSEAKVSGGTSRNNSQRRGIRALPSDPANFIAAEHTTDPTRHGEFELEADRAKDLMKRLKDGEAVWEPLLIDLDFSDVALETYAKCSSRHLREPCSYTVEYVVEVRGAERGEIVFGRMVMGQDEIEGCEEYARCVVQGNVGAHVRVPPGTSGLLANQKNQTDNHPDATVEQLEEMLRIVSEGVDYMEEQGPDGSPDWEYRLELERSYVTLIKWRIEALQG